MPDWKAMYLHLARETERAIRILTEAQQTCEELYVQSGEPELRLIASEAPASAPPRQNDPKKRETSAFSFQKPLTNPNSTDILDKPL